MGFCTFSKEYIKDGYTLIDNVFIGRYLPSADATDAKVYLYGLFLATNGDNCDNSIEKIALALKLSEEKIVSSFKYWEQKGIVSVSKTQPVRITYCSVKLPLTPVVKINAQDYSTFVEEMSRIFPSKVLSENELLSYIELMQEYKIETNAMLMIATYCMEIKSVVSSPYILAVASDWARQGIITEGAVSEHIAQLEQNSEDIRQIFKALGLKSQAGLDDRQLYLKWTKDYGYKMDALLVASRMCKKRGGMDKLSQTIEELKNANATTAQEIEAYAKNKENNRALASDIITGIGGYYASYDMVIETYIAPWLAKGFDENALRAIAKFCFTRNIRTLDAVDSIVEKFYKLGILSADGIAKYIAKQVSIDNQIKEVLRHAGSESFVTNRDREYYHTFLENWGFSPEVILLVADNAYGKAFPMSYINRMLAVLKENNRFQYSEVVTFLADYKENTAKVTNKKEQFLQHEYTKEELNSVFRNLNDIDIEGGEI